MRVLIADAVFIKHARSPILLNLIANLCSGTRHWVELDPPLSLTDDIYNTPTFPPGAISWLESNRQYDLLHPLINGPRISASNPNCITISIQDREEPHWGANPPQLPLHAASDYLAMPLEILVEDETNDRAFVMGVAKPEAKATMQEAEQHHWIRFRHCGGSGMLNSISRLDDKESKRACVLFDSDALEPDKPSAEALKKTTECERRMLPFHRLRRRMIENYIPVPALKRWAESARRQHLVHQGRWRLVRAFERLGLDHRHHYNMRAGFTKPRDEQYVQDGNSIFASVPTEVIEDLMPGFSSEITKLFENGIEPRWLEADEQRSEMNLLTDMILSRI